MRGFIRELFGCAPVQKYGGPKTTGSTFGPKFGTFWTL